MTFSISNSEFSGYTLQHQNWYVQLPDTIKSCNSGDSIIIWEGLIYDLNISRELRGNEILELVEKSIRTKKVFDENITGQFSIVCIHASGIALINDFCGSIPLYFRANEESVYITNNEFSLKEKGFEIDTIGLVQSAIPLMYIPLGNRTCFKDFSRLEPGAFLHLDSSGRRLFKLIDEMTCSNAPISNQEMIVEIDEHLKRNAAIYTSSFENIVLPFSGGVDSRIILSSFRSQLKEKHVVAVSYGEPYYSDNKIAAEVCNKNGIAHFNASFRKNLFPSIKDLELLFNAGGQYLIYGWHSVKELLKKEGWSKKEKSVVLLGDMLDLLRAKNIKSIRSRKQRVKFALSKFFGVKTNRNHKLDQEKFIAEVFENHLKRLNALLELNPNFLIDNNLDLATFLEESKKDIAEFVALVVNKCKPNYQENLEECYYILSYGSRTMAKQVLVFKDLIEAFAPLQSRHLVKYLLNFDPYDRFEDKLTHKLLMLNKNVDLAKFPTSQIPFVKYSSNQNLKYLLWALRSLIDQVTIRLKMRGILNFERINKNIEWTAYYSNKKNEIALDEILGNNVFSEIAKRMYTDRATGKAWLATATDINALMVANLFLQAKK